MEQQKMWVCIGIGFVLLLAVLAAVLFSDTEGPLSTDVRFVCASAQTEDGSDGQAHYAFLQDSPESMNLI